MDSYVVLSRQNIESALGNPLFFYQILSYSPTNNPSKPITRLLFSHFSGIVKDTVASEFRSEDLEDSFLDPLFRVIDGA